ncbi:MAG: hypothetical protein PHN24_12685 [Eubacteriales bacterium]|nr:hypothetical protein [Eubacteriales bacterium]
MEYGLTTAEKKKHLLLKSKSPLDIQQAYTYDDKGNVLTQQTQNSDGSVFIKGDEDERRQWRMKRNAVPTSHRAMRAKVKQCDNGELRAAEYYRLNGCHLGFRQSVPLSRLRVR